MAKKLQSSLAVEGELPENGLAAYGDDGDDLMMALARRIVSGDEEDDVETVEQVFTQARDAEATAEDLLVDDGWKQIEPEAVGVNGLPRTGYGVNGINGHHPDGMGPTIELVPTHGSNANGNGHHEGDAEESQQSLFSWAEFMAKESVKSNGRSRKSKPASTSLFEWALSLEREEETVGAGR